MKINKKSIIMFNIFLMIEILTLFLVKDNILILVVDYCAVFTIFMIYALLYFKSLKKMILSIEVFVELIFFLYAILAPIMFILDNYVPRITYFKIDSISIFETLRLYFCININYILIVLIRGLRTADYEEIKDYKSIKNTKLTLWDIAAIIFTLIYAYSFVKNGGSIIGAYFQDVRKATVGESNFLSSYIYLFMIPYTFLRLKNVFSSDQKILKTFLNNNIISNITIIVFWIFSLLIDRRNFVNLLIILVLVFIYNRKKILFRYIACFILITFCILFMSYTRAQTSRKDFNTIFFLSNGEFILTNYVSNFYMNHDYNMRYGSTYVYDTLITIIPRSFFKDKPEMLSETFVKEAKTNVAYAFNPVAEGIINFGPTGASIIVPFVMCFFVELAYIARKRNFLYYCVIYSYMINFYRGTFSVTMFAIFVMLLVTSLMNYKRKDIQ